MNYLKNKRAWKKWLAKESLDLKFITTSEPKEYPCYAYRTILSFPEHDETTENYLYVDDIGVMYETIFLGISKKANA